MITWDDIPNCLEEKLLNIIWADRAAQITDKSIRLAASHEARQKEIAAKIEAISDLIKNASCKGLFSIEFGMEQDSEIVSILRSAGYQCMVWSDKKMSICWGENFLP